MEEANVVLEGGDGTKEQAVLSILSNKGATDFVETALQMIIACVLAPAAFFVGQAAQRIRLPRITGYLLMGVLVGPYALDLLKSSTVRHLWFVEQACLSVILLAAGSELKLAQLQRTKTQVLAITFSVAACTWVIVFVGMANLFPYLHLPDDLQHHKLIAVASLSATMMIARSPASAIAVLNDSQGKGPFCSLVLLVVVFKDVLTIVLFALNIECVKLMFRPPTQGLDIWALLEPFRAISSGVVMGAVASRVFTLVLRPWPFAAARLHPGVVLRAKAALVVVGAFALFQTAAFLHAEPLLACLVAGLGISNRLGGERVSQELEELHAVFGVSMPYINIAFFGLAGVALKLPSLHKALSGAVVIFSLRLLAVYVGSHIGCTLGGCSSETTTRFWRSMVTQAGVALGLARMVATGFPEWGPHFQTQMVATIILNQLVGPPLFKAAITAAGEEQVGAGGLLED